MDEHQFRTLYSEVNPQRCVFEKAINARRCDCSFKKGFMLAGREGVACQNPTARLGCAEFLSDARQRARFALGVTQAEGPLPHSQEIRVQVGGLLALQGATLPGQLEATEVYDIRKTLELANLRFHALDAYPWETLVRGIARFIVPRRSPR